MQKVYIRLLFQYISILYHSTISLTQSPDSQAIRKIYKLLFGLSIWIIFKSENEGEEILLFVQRKNIRR
jgi:hypothetical protein